MNTPQWKSARTWVIQAREKQDLAQADYDAEVQLYKQYEKDLLVAFNDKVLKG